VGRGKGLQRSQTRVLSNVRSKTSFGCLYSLFIVCGRAHDFASCSPPEAGPLAPSGNRSLGGVTRFERPTGQTLRLVVRPVAFGSGLRHYGPRVHRHSENVVQSRAGGCNFRPTRPRSCSVSYGRVIQPQMLARYDLLRCFVPVRNGDITGRAVGVLTRHVCPHDTHRHSRSRRIYTELVDRTR
jgi:hypothetical protein